MRRKHFNPLNGFDDTEYERDAGRLEETDVTCRRCGVEGLEWVDVGGANKRWRLYDGDRLHTCPSATADDFEVIE